MHKITLKIPLTISGNDICELTLRRPKVRDRLIVERMGTNDAEKEVALISNLTGITREEVEELDLADYASIQEALQGFLSPILKKT